MINEGIGFEISNVNEMQNTISELLGNKKSLEDLQQLAKLYIEKQSGAVLKISQNIKKLLS